MKTKFKSILCCFALVLCGCGLMLLSTGCGPTELDMSGVSVEKEQTIVYNGQPQAVTLTGELPKGVEASYAYFEDEAMTQPVTAPINVGTYYAKISFEVDKKYKPVEAMTAKLVITKANFSNVDVVLGATYVDGEETKTAEVRQDGDAFFVEYNYELNYTIKVASSSADGDTSIVPNVKYYTALKEEGKVDEESEVLIGGNTIKSAGDVRYIVYTFSDDNHNPVSIMKSITVTKKIIKMSTYADLLKMKEDANTLSEDIRKNYVYQLQNNISCENAVWKTVGGVTFGIDGDRPFCSEFDGQGYTISNFQLTNESVDNITDQNGPCIGFFGYIVSSYIHDVTFENVTGNINTVGYDRIDLGGNCLNPLHFGVVFARGESDGSHGTETDLKNIKVKNADIRIDAYKQHVGFIIGMDHVKNVETLRENLDVENGTLYARSGSLVTEVINIGGIVGRTQGGNVVEYKNCDLKNVKLGFDYKSWRDALSVSDPDADNYTSNIYAVRTRVGVFAGALDGNMATFTNCSVTNYSVYRNKYNGQAFPIYGAAGYVNHSDGYPATWYITLNNCTHNQEDEYLAENEYVGFWNDSDQTEPTDEDGWAGNSYGW